MDAPPKYEEVSKSTKGSPGATAPPLGQPDYRSYATFPPNMAPPGYTAYPVPPAPIYSATQPVVVQETQVIVVGTCPVCRVGMICDDYPLSAICCAILFFPLGILCCLAMRQRRCVNCNAIFA